MAQATRRHRHQLLGPAGAVAGVPLALQDAAFLQLPNAGGSSSSPSASASPFHGDASIASRLSVSSSDSGCLRSYPGDGAPLPASEESPLRRTLSGGAGEWSVRSSISAGHNSGHVDAPSDDARDAAPESEHQHPPDLLIPAEALLLLRHGDFKCQLQDELDMASERLEVMTQEASFHRDSIEEEIKRSAVMRKIVLLLKGQLRDERQRRDKLVRQRKDQANAVIDSLKALVGLRHKEIEVLETELARKRQLVNMRRQKLEALREDITYARIDSEAEWRKGNRRLEAHRTQAEKVDRSDRFAWINTLRGGPEPPPPPDTRASVADLLKSKRHFDEVYTQREEDDDLQALREISIGVDQLEAKVERQRTIAAEIIRKSTEARAQRPHPVVGEICARGASPGAQPKPDTGGASSPRAPTS